MFEATYEDLRVVECWLTAQIDELSGMITAAYSDLPSLHKERDVFEDYRETVQYQLEALNDFATEQAIAKQEAE